MKRDNCKQQLIDYLKQNPGWHRKVHLFVLGDEWGYSPVTIDRKLRLAAELKEIQDGEYDGRYAKGLKKYCYDKPVERKLTIKVVDGKAIQTYV